MRRRGRRTAAERLDARVDRSGGPDACWLWTAKVDARGRGRLVVNGTPYLAHRLAFELASGQPIPPSLCVCHHCDVRYPNGDITNRRCCNPAHLWLGTNAENMADMAAKGRAFRAYGEASGMTKLTNADAAMVRSRRAAGEPLKSIAASFGISKQSVCDISKGRSHARSVAAFCCGASHS